MNKTNLFKQLSRASLLFAAATFTLVACKKKDNDGPAGGTDDPITLDCSFFNESGKDIILTDNPDAPVDYIVDCNAKIQGDLTIEPGVVIEFTGNAGFVFETNSNYKIDMRGTSSKPIVLSGKQKDKGFWRGIFTTSNHPANAIEYVTIEYAGSSSQGNNMVGAIKGRSGAVLNIKNSTIQHNKEYGIYWDNGGGDLTVSNTKITGNDVPVKTSVNHVNRIDNNSSFTGNVNDYIELTGSDAREDVTFQKYDVPYFSKGFKPNNDEARRFEFKAGVTFIMDAGSAITFDNAFSHEHATIMKGNSDQRIIFKGKEDVAGYWEGITIYSGNPLNEMVFVDIANAGITSGHPNGALKINHQDAFFKFNYINFINCYDFAVSVKTGNNGPSLEYSNLQLVNTPRMFSDWNGNEINP